MIRTEAQSIPQADIDKLLEWLTHPGRIVANKIVSGEIARLEAEACSFVTDKPVGYLVDQAVSDKARQSFFEACQWKLFLDKLDALNNHNKVKLVTQNLIIPPYGSTN